MKFLAQVPLGQVGGGGGLGPFSGVSGEGSANAIATILSSVIGVMTIGGAIWFLFNILIAGFTWISAGGDKTKLQTARDKITNAFIGLVVVVAAWALLALAGTFFGVNFTDFGQLINNVRIGQ